MSKVQTAILFGGTNSEHEVSLMSATSVLNNIDREQYQVTMVGITRDGRWYAYTGPVEKIRDGSWEQESACLTPAFIAPDRSIHGLVLLGENGMETRRIDVAFPVMHGRYAEDGTMQGLFALAGIPCVGPGTTASAVCMDKQITHTILDSVGISTARYLTLLRSAGLTTQQVDGQIQEKLGGYPVFIKPANAGSSVGVTKVTGPESLEAALTLAFASDPESDPKLIIEEMVTGAEVECAVLGNGDPVASDVLGEIVPKAEFYDYDAKYFDEATDLYIPARISPEDTQRIRETAVRAFRALGCKGLTRMDFFLKPDGQIILNEPNTLPGFTHISMYPKLFIASGVSYSQLISRLLTLAMEEAALLQ